MGEVISHRGPDESSLYDNCNLSLAYRRLAIVDPEKGQQPFFSLDGNQVLACNGEIYNHADIRRDLSPEFSFRSNSDCEVVLHGYSKWGNEVFSKLRGMFAVVHWDARNKKLTLAVDRFGIKPLYYFATEGIVLFASELKALIQHPVLRGKVNIEGNCYIYTDISAVNLIPGVVCIEPGSCVEFDAQGQVEKKYYWHLRSFFGTAPFGSKAANYREAFHNLLEDAIGEQIANDLPTALHLSGGIDSSILATVAKAKGKNLDCFTVAKRGTWLAGDVDSARRVTESLGLSWFPVFFDYRTFSEDINFSLERLEQLIWMVESPQFDIEWVYKEELTRVIRRECPKTKVLLTGQGVDEFAGGYSKRIDNSHPNWERYIDDEITPWLKLHSDKLLAARPKSPPLGSFSAYHQAMHLMIVRMHSYNLWHEDRTSSYHGMEARLPFLDHRLIELLASIPPSLHSELFWNKGIVRGFLKKSLPDYRENHPKIGFYNTLDQRSLNITMHQLVSQIVWDFYDKYYLSFRDDSEIHEFDFFAEAVTKRKPGFYFYSHKLMNLMCEKIFSRIFSSGLGVDNGRNRRSQLRVINEFEFEAIGNYFEQQPIIGLEWLDDYQVNRMESCHILMTDEGDKSDYCLVNDEGLVVSRISFDNVSPPLRLFLERFREADEVKTLSCWLAETKLRRADLVSTLNTFLQCGFIIPPG